MIANKVTKLQTNIVKNTGNQWQYLYLVGCREAK